MEVRFGILLRSYAANQQQTEEVVRRSALSVKHTQNIKRITKTVILIPSDYDCGIAKELKKKTLHYDKNQVMQAPGHHSSQVLNYGIDRLKKDGITHAIIISHKAISYLDDNIIKKILTAINYGAHIIGISVNELEQYVEKGRVQNTFAIWNIKTLKSVGGFTSKTGVEEISPSIKIIKKLKRPCIAVIKPEVNTELNLRKHGGKERHTEVMITKEREQNKEIEKENITSEFLTKSILLTI